jgi:hypothetical protein
MKKGVKEKKGQLFSVLYLGDKWMTKMGWESWQFFAVIIATLIRQKNGD